MPNGFLVPVGERWKMPMFAETLRKVASEGADYLYTGEWGRKFVEKANKKGYRVSAEDMAEYQPTWDEPVEFTYRGHTLYGSPPPDTGGVIVGGNLNVLENFDLKAMGHYSESSDALEIMARAFGWVSDDTRHAIKDPLNFKMPIELWMSKDYGKMGAQFVENTMVLPNVNLKSAVEETTASLLGPSIEGSEGDGHAYLGSNHNVIVDDKGNWISMLHTGHGGAPGIFIDGVRATGSGARADTAGPGRRVVLPITAIMIAKDGKPWLAMGTPGSPPQPVTEVLVNILDYGMDPKDAADAPRFWAMRRDNRGIRIESRISKDVRDGLAARGIKIEDLGDYNWHTGSMQIVWKDLETGKLHGATDPRRLGSIAGY
jgi:gamma-glutamyltranspeptidase/glutathione hydrolase